MAWWSWMGAAAGVLLIGSGLAVARGKRLIGPGWLWGVRGAVPRAPERLRGWGTAVLGVGFLLQNALPPYVGQPDNSALGFKTVIFMALCLVSLGIVTVASRMSRRMDAADPADPPRPPTP